MANYFINQPHHFIKIHDLKTDDIVSHALSSSVFILHASIVTCQSTKKNLAHTGMYSIASRTINVSRAAHSGILSTDHHSKFRRAAHSGILPTQRPRVKEAHGRIPGRQMSGKVCCPNPTRIMYRTCSSVVVILPSSLTFATAIHCDTNSNACGCSLNRSHC